MKEENFKQISNLLINNKPLFKRKNSKVRRGSALGGNELQNSSLRTIIEQIDCNKFLKKVRLNTEIFNLQLVSKNDTNRVSILRYNNENDGIDWHVDGNIYFGDRWVGILTIIEDTKEKDAKLEIKPNGKKVTFPIDKIVNSLILFQGDQIRHRVRKMLNGEDRIVISLLFATNPRRTKNPILRFYQSWVNYIFYGSLKS